MMLAMTSSASTPATSLPSVFKVNRMSIRYP
jgi:hypothetical protein